MTEPPGRPDRIYKICAAEAWREAERTGRFDGAPVDLADGFIHFSTWAQLAETAARHFAGRTDLVLVTVDPDSLGEGLRYEPSRGGDLFPHLYGPMPLGAVVASEPLRLGPDGRHLVPAAGGSADKADVAADPIAAGWTRLPHDGFMGLVGPIYQRQDGNETVYAFVAEAKHLNRLGIVHGGMLTAFADQALGMTSWKAAGRSRQATIQLDTHFVSPVRLDDLVEARCRVVRQTRSVMFMTGTLAVGERVVANASGVWKLSGTPRAKT